MTKLDPVQLAQFEAHLVEVRLPFPYADEPDHTCPPLQPPRVGMVTFSASDLTRLNTCKGRVFALALSGRWFTNKELIELTGNVDAPKRRRELEHVDGYRFEKRRLNGTNVLEFRLIEETNDDTQSPV